MEPAELDRLLFPTPMEQTIEQRFPLWNLPSIVRPTPTPRAGIRIARLDPVPAA